MKINDLVAGVVLFALAVLILVYAQTLPPMPGQRYGAAAFPTVVALGLGGFSLMLAGQGWRERRPDTRWIEFSAWAHERHTRGNFVIALVLIAVYVLLSERIGFIPLSIAILVFLFLRQGVPLRRGVTIAVATTLAIQLAFSDVLRVPLPRGLLTEILW
ncbi:MAG: tripartite tricarboxylate transporter TctB family protein [Proteobacteria bacterium]|nr:tripartite tricarboxylate transporter TctB family protein [Pseudomonadota bacterium]